MIEGAKLIAFRIISLTFVILGAIPIYRLIYAYAAGTNPTYCADAFPLINTGVGMIFSIGCLGIGIACIQTYYRAVRQRQYEGVYYGDAFDAYNR